MAITYGKGTTLKLGSTAIGQLLNVSFNQSQSSIDITNLDSAHKAYSPGLHDAGEMSCQIQFDPADTQHAALHALLGTTTMSTFVITLTDTGTAIFSASGFLTAFDLSGMEEDGVVTADLTIKLSGAVTFTA